MMRHFINEVHYLTKMPHPHIVRVLETATNRPLYLSFPSPNQTKLQPDEL
jgi:hypothetical protein